MRYLTLILSCGFLLVGCTQPLVHHQGRQTTVAFDFSKYTEKGFLITPQRYHEDYQSVGQITLTLWPEANERTSENFAEDRASESDSLYSDGVWVIERITTEDLVDRIYREARSMGADAIVNFDVTPVTRELDAARTPGTLNLTGYEVRGFAINRAAK